MIPLTMIQNQMDAVDHPCHNEVEIFLPTMVYKINKAADTG